MSRVVITKTGITFSDLSVQPGVVLSAQEVEVFQGKPSKDILVGVCLPDADGPALHRYVTIEFHCGRMAWHLKTEHSIQRATNWEIGILPDLIRKFESLVDVTLPEIKIFEIGLGIYSARSRYASENPWQMQNGMFYTVRDPQRGLRTIVADVRNGRTLIAFVPNDDKPICGMETYDPSVVLTEHEWRSLTPSAKQ